jgi:hypothetical protein
LSPAHPRSEPDFHGLQKSFQIQETKVEAAGGLEKKAARRILHLLFLGDPWASGHIGMPDNFKAMRFIPCGLKEPLQRITDPFYSLQTVVLQPEIVA